MDYILELFIANRIYDTRLLILKLFYVISCTRRAEQNAKIFSSTEDHPKPSFTPARHPSDPVAGLQQYKDDIIQERRCRIEVRSMVWGTVDLQLGRQSDNGLENAAGKSLQGREYWQKDSK